MKITLDIPDEFAERLRCREEELPLILELGLREVEAAANRDFREPPMCWRCRLIHNFLAE